MESSMRRYSAALALPVALLAPVLLLGKKHQPPAADEHKRALHALNRLTFGPRPGDVQRVEAMDVDKWIELQLHPKKIDDSALASRLDPLRTLRMSTREMVEDFPPQPLIKAVADGRQSLPSDPQERAIYQAQLPRYQQKQEQQAALQSASSDSGANASDDERAQRRQERMDARADAEQILTLPPDQRMAAILRLPSEQQQVLLRSLPPKLAQLIKANVGVQIAFADIGGWDHHVNEGSTQGQLANVLRDFSQSLAAFWTDLGDLAEDTVVVTMSEFGRTARENGNRGTDHGHANVMFVLGGPVRGGQIYGQWPGLEPEQLNEGRDLALTTDFRRVLGEVLSRHLGNHDLASVFPGFDNSAAGFLKLLG